MDFLIIGGTGKVGGRLARRLRAAGHLAVVASRTSGDVRFDWHDATTHAAELNGIDGVFVVGPGSATDWSDLLTAFLTLAHDAGVRRAVLLSARGVQFLPDGAVALAERALRNGPVAWTILRPTHFAQNFTEAMFTPVDGQIAAPVGDGAEPFVDVEDIAEVAAAILVDGGHAGETLELSGPAAITFSEAAEILSRHAGRPLHYRAEDPDAHADRLRAAGTPDGYVTWRMAMLDGIRRGADAHLSDGIAQVIGRPATDFETWAAREASAS